MTRAATMEELAPLLALCKAGRLFDVQEWARQKKPVALPEGAASKFAQRNPLRVAMDTEFHSMVQVLLEAGAPVREGNYNALAHAVELRRDDLAALLVKHGANVRDVSMRLVVDMWNPSTMELFVAHGASLIDGSPIAWGLINKVRTALRLVKQYAPTVPDVMRQAETALRFHAKEGNAKWVSLLLWVGADPMARGPYSADDAYDESEEDEHESATGLAVIYGQAEVLAIKRMLPAQDPSRPETVRLIERGCYGSKGAVLDLLLARGHSPKLLPDQGTGGISTILHWMSWDIGHRIPHYGMNVQAGIDTSNAMEQMKMLHQFVAHGGKWLPTDKKAIAEARKCLLKMAPKYTLEFIWLMKEYQAARRTDIEELLRQPSMTRHLGDERAAAQRMVVAISEEAPVA